MKWRVWVHLCRRFAQLFRSSGFSTVRWVSTYLSAQLPSQHETDFFIATPIERGISAPFPHSLLPLHSGWRCYPAVAPVEAHKMHAARCSLVLGFLPPAAFHTAHSLLLEPRALFAFRHWFTSRLWASLLSPLCHSSLSPGRWSICGSI